MLILVKEKASENTLKKLAEDLSGYIKVVVDVEKEIMAAGGLRHVEGEELLLKEGSKQENLWGGGLDLETSEIDFDSMINLRPSQNNPSREVLPQDIRRIMENIIRKFLK